LGNIDLIHSGFEAFSSIRSFDETKYKILVPKEPGKEWPKVYSHITTN
jgi:hypothetical protein